MKRIFYFVGASIIVASVSFLIAFKAESTPSHSFRPFTAIWLERYYPGGQLQSAARVVHKVYGRREDGSSASAFSLQSPDGTETLTGKAIVDVSSDVSIQLEPFTRSKTTFRRLGPADLPAAPTPGCGAQQGAQHERILGYDVVPVTREVDYGGVSRVTTTAWLATALDCYPLRIVENQIDPASPISVRPHNEKEVTLIIEGFPPDSLFDVSMDHTERSPAQVHDAWLQRFPDHPLAPMSAEKQRLEDEAYNARNGRQ